jgi:predicted ATPase
MAPKPTSPPPAYFLSLSLENVRSFGEKQTISFADKNGRPAQWTIILGDNGVGKTTVLKALAAVIPEESGKDRFVSAYANGKYSDWLPWRGKGDKEAVFRLLTEGNNRLAQTNKKELPRENFEFFFSMPSYKPNSFHFFSYEGTFVQNTPFAPSLICYGYGAGRTTGNSTISEAPANVDNCVSLFDDRADLLNPEEWFLRMEYSSLKHSEQAGISLEQVRQVLLQVLPDVTDIQIRSDSRQQYLALQTPYGWVRLRDMSLGYQTLVVWLTDFASKLFIRYPDSPNPLEEPAIVLIDEIDLHLHPEWQRKLIGFLSGIFKNTQFIATAHSPLIVQAAGDAGANVVLLRREGDQTIVVKDLPDVQRWRIDQILNSELFDDVPAHSLETEKQLRRRDELLAKSRLTAKDRAELDGLNRLAHGQPVGESSGERRAADVLRELARKLGKQELLD